MGYYYIAPSGLCMADNYFFLLVFLAAFLLDFLPVFLAAFFVILLLAVEVLRL
ncbi:MAG TPA: hypothetical protein VGN95_20870 [Pyrinomonadaceae bacterium]|nr:hypothetical protein [Pyrinomonadaceae bacterium]